MLMHLRFDQYDAIFGDDPEAYLSFLDTLEATLAKVLQDDHEEEEKIEGQGHEWDLQEAEAPSLPEPSIEVISHLLR